MSNELKPCPFCGGEAVISGCDGGDLIVICNVRDLRAERELSKIEQSIIDKCYAALKGGEG